MWMTYGQWLQMNMTSVPFAPVSEEDARAFPSAESGSVKAGSGVPSGNIVDGVADMPHA